VKQNAHREAVRPPAVAGRFYPGDPDELEEVVNEYLSAKVAKCSAFGCVVPHAGYIYSGHVAGAVYATLKLPRRCVILGPNHTGCGDPLAINRHGGWETPLGEAQIDESLAAELSAAFPMLSDDAAAHLAEHSIEVQLPFLQRCVRDLRFVPICIGTSNFALLAGLGKALAATIRRMKEPVIIIASSDMNHYESDQITRVKDGKAIDAILTFGGRDADAGRALYDIVHHQQISMCGYAPAVVMLTACARLGATGAELVRYATSGDVNGDRGRVVGYAGMIVV
jgi:AmmeMemoRadiSam system protein B